MTPLTLGVVGIDHRHIFGQLSGMMELGCTCKGWWTEGEPQPVEGFLKRFPDVPRVGDLRMLLDDPEIDMILIADVPARRADRAMEAMRSGKDVMLDKPGCTTLEQLEDIKACVAETGRIWSIDFSERFEVRAVSKAAELVRDGAIGEIIQTVGLGPHRLNRPTRPDWFFDDRMYGGILTDIASHQIDQFLFFTGSQDAEIITSSVGNFANPDDPGLQDFGEILLRSGNRQGYIRVDWYTPDALPTWGDGRLVISGTEGQIELRKYVDIAGRSGTDHVFLVNKDRYEYIDASGEDLPYFANLINDVNTRSETAMSQAHCFKVMELALKAQAKATRLGTLK
ncbi:Gfo/Idh/MocA family protein [Roseibium album]|uniref:Putative oxidoreductase YvaA n=1 Tax=Roseibium album TaxID=311410 RepID=A0A0M7AWD0_9HYPH|nr:Gfo/Idh/MocA family oxidoreductase [Roseibium album]CTQ61562.1 putative oxidoreductase YvaA [Roseibium album]CTQ75824.1 putative oxidoreductase YvaA [Roseibium album]CTQ78053.1 putative oxidoreductase YvaA [Roseibium album]